MEIDFSWQFLKIF